MRSQRRLYRNQSSPFSIESAGTLDLGAKFGLSGGHQNSRFASDYSHIFFSGNSNLKMFNTPDPGDPNTWTFNSEIQLQGIDHRGSHMNNDGTKIYFGRSSVWQYTLTTPYDLTTAVLDGSISLGGYCSGINMNLDQSKFFYNTYYPATKNIEYNLSVPGDILSTKTLVQEKLEPDMAYYEWNFTWGKGGTRVFGIYRGALYLHEVSTPYTLDGFTPFFNFGNSGGGASHNNVEIHEPSNKVYIVSTYGTTVLYIYNIINPL